MKKFVSALLVVVMVLTAALPALAAAPAIKKTEYEGSGYVEVDFKKNVSYKNAKVTVKDSDGKSYKVSIQEKDSDDLTFKVSSIAAGKTYAYTVSGIRSGKSGSYGSVSGSFKTPAAKKLSIKELDFDYGDKELEIEFSGKVQYKSLKVKVTDANGKSYTVKLRDKDSDSVEVRVSGLSKNKKYTVTVSGVRLKNTGSYGSVGGSFTAR